MCGRGAQRHLLPSRPSEIVDMKIIAETCCRNILCLGRVSRPEILWGCVKQTQNYIHSLQTHCQAVLSNSESN